MRRGEWPEIATVSGIECVGLVVEDPSGTLPMGTRVLALMGGMGRTRNGSYAEYVSVPGSNVVPVQTSLDWSELAALPESYATAWSALHVNLRLQRGETLLVRGATSALGQAAVTLGAARGATVFATTRREDRMPMLSLLGARAFLEDAGLRERIAEERPGGVDAVLDLIGNSGFAESVRMARMRSGRVCIAGFLGGAAPVTFDALSSLTPGVELSLFASFAYGAPAYPLSEIPFQQIVDDVASGRLQAKPAAVFQFERIADAHRLMESNEAGGKIVIVL